MAPIQIQEITFDDILPIWKTNLWPHRKSIIEPMSAVAFDGSINIDIFKYSESTFYLAAVMDQSIVGVISGHKTQEKQCRLRGLYVDENYRRQSISTHLIQAQLTKAKALKCDQVWALARVTNSGLFEKLGFQIQLETDKYEYGPHHILAKKI